MKITSLLSGVAGEYFVAAELSRRGFTASISLRNTRGIDIQVTNEETMRSATIQCKTNQLARKIWLLTDKSETFKSPDHFYVFVALGDLLQRPSFHIVPSADVADHASAFHQAWLSTPGEKGQRRKDSSMRKFADRTDKYLERWELLGL